MSEDKTKNQGKGKPDKSAAPNESADPAQSASTPSKGRQDATPAAPQSDAGQSKTASPGASSGTQSTGQGAPPVGESTRQQSKDKNDKGSPDRTSSGSSAKQAAASKSASGNAGASASSRTTSGSTQSSSAKTASASSRADGGNHGTGSTAGGAGGQGGGKSATIGLVIAIVALIIALLAAAGAGWLWYRSQSTVAELNSRVDTVEKGMQSNVQKVVMPRLSEMKERIQSLSSDVSGLSDRLDKRKKQIKKLHKQVRNAQTHTSELADRLDGTHQRYARQRVESLLEAANQRLRLYQDPASAQQALELADQAIQQTGDPRLFPVRRDIADEIASLKALPDPDIEGLSLTLSNLIKQVPDLPLATDVPSEYDNGSSSQDASGQADSNALSSIDVSRGWHHFVDSLGGALSSMVTVRRANGTQNAPALMAPDQAYFLTQNLQLQLRSAQLALLNHDTQAYQDNLSSARDWIKQYFDGDASSVKAALKTFSELSHVKLDWQAPDISASLTSLRQLMNNQKTSTGEADSGAAEADDTDSDKADGGSEQ